MHIDADLNLVPVLATLYRTQNVTRTAKTLQMSQSAVSHALGRLREQLGDPLFVRTARGVVPTDFALSIRPEVEALESAALALFRRRDFDPEHASGRVTIATTDYFELVAGASLAAALGREAPGVQLSIRPTGDTLPTADLEAGRADLAIAGFYSDLPDGFHSTKVLKDRMRSAVARGRPIPDSKKKFLAARHALITIQGDFADALQDHLDRPRTFAYGTSSFAAAAWVLAESDLVLTAPERLLRRFAERFAIDVFETPGVPDRTIALRMVWHARTHADPLQKWVRARVREALDR